MNTTSPNLYNEIEDGRPVDLTMRRDLMSRVGYIHGMRRILNPEIVKAVVFVASVTGVTFMIHIEQVISNMATLGGFKSYPGYIYIAFVHTSWPVQSAIVLGSAAGVWLVGNLAWRSGLATRLHLRHA